MSDDEENTTPLLPPDSTNNVPIDEDERIQLNEESAKSLYVKCGHEEVGSPLVTSFCLPTPPPSSDESDDESSDSGGAMHNTSKEQNQLSTTGAPQQLHDSSTGAPQQPHEEEATRFETSDDLIEENAMSEGVSFFQLPTQYSSSSSEDDDCSTVPNVRPSNNGSASVHASSPRQTLTGESGMAADNTAISKKGQGNLNGSQSQKGLASNPESRHVQFNTNSSKKMFAAEDLTDTPVKASFPIQLETSTRMSLDSSTDTPINQRRNTVQQRMSLDSLADTPVQPRRSAGQQRIAQDSLSDTPLLPRQHFRRLKSLDSLTDTPVQPRENIGHQRKRLRAATKSDTSKQLEQGTTEKPPRQERVRKRLEEKYRSRFLDLEAANDDSGVSDEEDAIRQIEDEELSRDSFINDTSQLGYTQDDLDCGVADAEVEVCDHEDSMLHRQFDHNHYLDNQFKTPVFNRRMRTNASQSQHSQSSQKGLGNMNFIRSVLEHHRQGGDADHLEETYHQLNKPNQEANRSDYDSPVQSNKNSAHLGPWSQANGVAVLATHTNPSNSIQVGLGPQQKIHSTGVGQVVPTAPSTSVASSSVSIPRPVVLTAEQRAMIESKRAKALKRRQQRTKQQQHATPFNPYAT